MKNNGAVEPILESDEDDHESMQFSEPIKQEEVKISKVVVQDEQEKKDNDSDDEDIFYDSQDRFPTESILNII